MIIKDKMNLRYHQQGTERVSQHFDVGSIRFKNYIQKNGVQSIKR